MKTRRFYLPELQIRCNSSGQGSYGRWKEIVYWLTVDICPSAIYVQAKRGTKRTNQYLQRRPSPCKLQPVLTLLHVGRQKWVRWRIPRDSAITVRSLNKFHSYISNRVPLNPHQLFLQYLFPWKRFQQKRFELLNGRRLKSIRLNQSWPASWQCSHLACKSF